nr:hypothetical protein BaRGS_004358 [Batillaria attramentaria]
MVNLNIGIVSESTNSRGTKLGMLIDSRTTNTCTRGIKLGIMKAIDEIFTNRSQLNGLDLLVDLTSDIGFHLINLQGCLYVMSSEVSALFWEDDILGSMLKQSNFNVSKLVVTRDQYPALFQELLSLPLILEIFGNASPAITELSEAILDIAKNFDPSDPYWKKSESTTDQDTDLDDILTMEELQMALRSLQILRKRILKRMTVEAVCTPSDITELEDTESNIKQTQALINTLQQSSALPIQEQTSVAQMAATNRQMEEIIKQQDQMLQSMLMMGWNPRLLNPGIYKTVEATNEE